MTLDEYGLFRNHDGTGVAGLMEEDVYATLGAAWTPPKRREDPAQIDAVAAVAVAMEV